MPGQQNLGWIATTLLGGSITTGVDELLRIRAGGITVNPGAEEVLALLEVRAQARSGEWDVLERGVAQRVRADYEELSGRRNDPPVAVRSSATASAPACGCTHVKGRWWTKYSRAGSVARLR